MPAFGLQGVLQRVPLLTRRCKFSEFFGRVQNVVPLLYFAFFPDPIQGVDNQMVVNGKKFSEYNIQFCNVVLLHLLDESVERYAKAFVVQHLSQVADILFQYLLEVP